MSESLKNKSTEYKTNRSTVIEGIELLPCPVCGRTTTSVSVNKEIIGYTARLCCEDCKRYVEELGFSESHAKKQAAEIWNYRGI